MGTNIPRTKLLDLPSELIICICQYLEPPEFLTLCCSSKRLWALKFEPSFWRRVTQSAYRLPNQPLQESDGARWLNLYRRLRTESRTYTWGNPSASGGLGHARRENNNPSAAPRRYDNANGVAWPTEMQGLDKLDPVVDIQCGGCSTTLLTSKGDLYSVGYLRDDVPCAVRQQLERLKFPAADSQGHRRTADSTVAQFSVGRTEILALSDSGLLWLWSSDMAAPAARIEFQKLDVSENAAAGAWKILRIVAGWHVNSVYVSGKGIVYWKEVHRRSVLPNRPHGAPPPSVVPVDDRLVPQTSYQRPQRLAREVSVEDEELGKTVGEVTSHVMLENYIVFLTDLGKVFAIRHTTSVAAGRGIFELHNFEPTESDGKMSDLQGAFRSFAVFNTGGDVVVIGDQELLDRAWTRAFEPPRSSSTEEDVLLLPERPPELQGRGVVSLAFGDWHRLALTKEGHVLASGREPVSCGCLGLGPHSGEGPLRGIHYTEPQFSLEGDIQGQWRQVWFSPEQREWLRYMRRGGVDLVYGKFWVAHMYEDSARRREMADWVEANGARWDLHPALDDEQEPWGRGEPAYLTLKISAAGWRSAALVLGNKSKIDRMYRSHAGFLPATQDTAAAATPGVVSRMINRVLTLGTTDGPAESGPAAAIEDQIEGRDHKHYYSQWQGDASRHGVHDAARHEVHFPVFPTGAQQA